MNPPTTPAGDAGTRPRTRLRLLAALALIAVALVALFVFERHRIPLERPAAPHEPSQALIAPPGEQAAAGSSPALPLPPSPPEVVNELDLPRESRAPGDGPTAAPANAAYVVQAGVFASPANARALQERLAKSGIRAKIETRVHMGPYKDRKEAEQAMATLRKLGVSAVIVPSR